MNKCEFCNSPIPYNVNNCPACGAPCKYIPEPQPKQQISISGKTVRIDKSSGYVESMADVDIDLKKSSNDSFFDDDLEADLETTRKRNAAAAKNTVLGCTILIIIVSIIIAIIVSAVS